MRVKGNVPGKGLAEIEFDCDRIASLRLLGAVPFVALGLIDIGVLETARRMDPRFARSAPYYHLEGPYLSHGLARGVHDVSFMRAPRLDELASLQKAAGNSIGIVTLAPELPGAFDFISEATRRGITKTNHDHLHRRIDPSGLQVGNE